MARPLGPSALQSAGVPVPAGSGHSEWEYARDQSGADFPAEDTVPAAHRRDQGQVLPRDEAVYFDTEPLPGREWDQTESDFSDDYWKECAWSDDMLLEESRALQGSHERDGHVQGVHGNVVFVNTLGIEGPSLL